MLQPEWYFCPNCGESQKEKVPDISFFKQITIYLVSFFLAPLGLIWGIKYAKYDDKKTKLVGILSIVLTILSLIFMVLVFKGFIDQYAKTLNSMQNINIDSIEKLFQ